MQLVTGNCNIILGRQMWCKHFPCSKQNVGRNFVDLTICACVGMVAY